MSERLTQARHAHHRHEVRARRYAMAHHLVDAIAPSPARKEAHDPTSWFPLVAFPEPAGHHEPDHHHGPAYHHGAVRGDSVRPRPTRPAVIVRPSPAREEAHDPTSWFPIGELEALLAPDRLVPEQPAKPAPITLTPVVADPAPAPARVAPPTPTRAQVQRARRRRRRRRRLRLAIAGAGLGAGLLLAKLHLEGGTPSEITAEPQVADSDRAAGGEEGGGRLAEPLEPLGLSVIPAAQVIPEPPPPPPPPLPNEEIWDRMAQCETGGNWQHHGPTWSGGLGIYRGTWQEAGGTEFAPLPRDATREEQIIVAERIRERYGWTAWGCARTIGMG